MKASREKAQITYKGTRTFMEDSSVLISICGCLRSNRIKLEALGGKIILKLAFSVSKTTNKL